MTMRCLALLAGALVAACSLAIPFADYDRDTDNVAGSGGGGDAGSEGGALDAADAGDVGDAATTPACDLDAPFGTPVRIGDTTSNIQEECVRISTDELEMYVTRPYDSTGKFVQRYVRASRDVPFGSSPLRIMSIEDPTAYAECGFLAANGKELFFDSDPDGSTYDLYLTTRPNTASEFGPAVKVANVATPENETSAVLSGDELYYQAMRDAGFYLYRAIRGGNGAFGGGTRVTDLEQPDGSSPTLVSLTGDGLTIYFGRRYVGFRKATRASLSMPFGPDVEVQGLGDTSSDGMGSISADGCHIYFTSKRETGVEHTFYAEKPKR